MNEMLRSQVQAVAQPLAELLARFHISHPIHKEINAELYDAVNSIRDKELDRLKGLLKAEGGTEVYKTRLVEKIAFYEGK